MKKGLALFDFDGTITKRDTFLEIIKYQKGKAYFYFGMLLLSPILLLYKLKVIENWRAKERVLSFFFGGNPSDIFQSKCDQFISNILPTILKPEALQKIEFHRSQNHRVIVVSASPYNWIEGWCKKMEIELIATKLEVYGEKITGRLASLNCYGAEKVNRINEYLDLKEFDQIYAYGDSEGDKPMLAIAHHSFYRKF